MKVNVQVGAIRHFENKAASAELLSEIHAALDAGYNVHAGNIGYKVTRNKNAELFVTCTHNAYMIGLTSVDGEHWNVDAAKLFYITA